MPSFQTQALWTWAVSGATSPTVKTYSSSKATKTGLEPADLDSFVGVPLQFYGNPPQPMQDSQKLEFLRQAEDIVEQETGLLLCQTWVASPPAYTMAEAQSINIGVASASGAVGPQVLGIDFDLEDAAYDFMFPRAQDEGWMIYSLRYRPVKSVSYGSIENDALSNAIKNISYVYPLLNQYFRVPPSWQVEDRDFGLVRLVPSTNVQMLPLFAMELAFMGFAESVPGGIWMQYTAGLTGADYSSRYRFIRRLVLCEAAQAALSSIQLGINFGIEQQMVEIDGVKYSTRYPKEGPFSGVINRFIKERDHLMGKARDMVGGPIVTTL
jgi:hypothetical protein